MSTALPLVTAVVPVFDGERFLAEALDSVLAQDYPALEVVVVDDGSSDGSAAVAAARPQIRCLQQANQGVAAARNAGILAARGDVLAFLDQDDLWLPGKLARQVGFLLAHPETGYVLAWQRIEVAPGAVAPPWFPRHLLAEPHLGFFPGTLVANRWAFDEVGLYDPLMPPAESADWFARAKDAGVARGVVEEVLLVKRLHEANQSHPVWRVRAQVLAALKASIDRQRRRHREGGGDGHA